MSPADDWVRSSGPYALDFDGSNDYVSCGIQAGNLTESASFSVSIWGYPRAFSTFTALMSRNVSSPFPFALRVPSGGNLSLSCDGVQIAGSITSAANQWHHYACTITPGRRILYVNGLVAADSTAAYTITANNDELRIGTDYIPAADRCWNGLIDDVAIYNRALTAGEIRTLSRRRGIAYEARRNQDYGSSGFQAAWARQRAQLIGGGLR
jgi:hypothetical protein